MLYRKFSKKIPVVTALSLAMLLSGCGGGVADRRENGNNVNDVINQQVKEEEGKKEAGKESTEVVEVTTEALPEPTTEVTTEAVTEVASEVLTEEYLGEPDPNVDIDLTVMSKDMIYATVYQMMLSPEEFVGKKVKADGIYASGYYDATGKWYHYCIIKDAQACCQQGMEFTWEDGSHDLSEYPEQGAEIQVIGTFRIYKDFEDDVQQYCELASSDMTVLTEEPVNE